MAAEGRFFCWEKFKHITFVKKIINSQERKKTWKEQLKKNLEK